MWRETFSSSAAEIMFGLIVFEQFAYIFGVCSSLGTVSFRRYLTLVMGRMALYTVDRRTRLVF